MSEKKKWSKKDILELYKSHPYGTLPKKLKRSSVAISIKKRSLGLSRHKTKWLKKYDNILGKVPDAIIAGKIGRHTATVRNRRIALGIQACILTKFSAMNIRQRKVQWKMVDWLKTDAEIARDLGCSREAVGHQRKKLSDLK